MNRFRFSSRGLALVALALAVVLAAPEARANLLYPGDSLITPDSPIPNSPLSNWTALSPLLTSNFSVTFGGPILGTLYSQVFTDNTGDLLFLYQITMAANSASVPTTFAVQGYGGYGGYGPAEGTNPAGSAVEAGYDGGINAPGQTGTIAPIAMSRNGAGTPIDFVFGSGPTNSLQPGATSDTLFVEVKAETYQTVSELLQDGGQLTALGYAPGPEPSSMVLAGLGVLGLVGYGLRRRKALGA